MRAVLITILMAFSQPALAVEEASPQQTPKPAAAKKEAKPKPAPVAWQAVKENSQLRFVAMYQGKPLEGAFQDFTAKIMFHPENAEASQVEVEVPLRTVKMQDATQAATLQNAEWFNSAAHPTATFRTKTMQRMLRLLEGGVQDFFGDGELTLKGITRPVQYSFRLVRYTESDAIVEGRVTLLRREFNVGEGEWQKLDVIDDPVGVNFRIVAKRL